MKAAQFESATDAKRAADKKLSFFYSMVEATKKSDATPQGKKPGTSHARQKKPAHAE